jgi:plasmid stabilization system protein ParE
VFNQLAATPYSFRKAGKIPTRRELIIPFGATGYVALYEIANPSSVVVLAVRHQREEDYH